MVEAHVEDGALAWIYRCHLASRSIEETPDAVKWSIHYRLVSLEAYERYITQDAPKMRGDGLTRFGGQFEATRRVLGPQDLQPLAQASRSASGVSC